MATATGAMTTGTCLVTSCTDVLKSGTGLEKVFKNPVEPTSGAVVAGC